MSLNLLHPLGDSLLVEIFKYIPLRRLLPIGLVCHQFSNILFHDQEISRNFGRVIISNPSESLIMSCYFWFLKFKEWHLNSSWKQLNYYYHNFTSSRIDQEVVCVRNNLWEKVIEKFPKQCKLKHLKLGRDNEWMAELLDDFYRKNPKINWKKMIYYFHTNTFEKLMISQFLDDLTSELNDSGYFTRESCWNYLVEEPQHVNELNDAFFLNDNQRQMDIIETCVDSQPTSCNKSYDIFDNLKMSFKPPITWFCSYERPRKLRKSWGILKQLITLMKNHKKLGKIRVTATIRFNDCSGYLIGNDDFAVFFGGRSC